MTETRKRWLSRHLRNGVLPVLLILVTTTAWASDNPARDFLNAGRRAFADGNFTQAEDYIRRSAEEAERVKTSENDLSLIFGDLGSVLQSVGKFEEAETYFNRAITILRAHPTIDRRQLPIQLGNIGKLYYQTGRLDRAEDVLREALQLGKKLLADEPQYLSDIYNNNGILHLRTGNRKQAERDFTKALTLIERNETRTTEALKVPIMASLATLYFMDKKWSLAEQTMIHSIEIVEATQGSAHPNLCALLNDLGYLYLRQNDLVRAESVLRRDLAIRRAAFGADSANTASAAATLASLLSARGEYDEAAKLFAEALKTQERILGRVPEVATTLDQFANLLRQTNNHALAGDLASRAESIRLEAGYTVSLNELHRR